jgi:glutamate-1-semialdehyde 2,1-aminomutase
MTIDRSGDRASHQDAAALYARGRQVLPGGVCSSTRLSAALQRPLYLSRAEGAHLIDVEGRRILDMSCGHGAALLGHGHPAIKAALVEAAELGLCCAADMEPHIELAETLCRLVPCAERVRFTNSGTEATLHAIRLCRAITGRDKIVRFTGHFHGYHELTFIGGHPPASELDNASSFRESAGIPEPMTEFIIALPFNDLDAVAQTLRARAHEIATVILEPVDFNSGGIPPQPGYLEGLRQLTREHDVLLFFDEIQTIFKKSTGGAQQDFGVVPDLCTIGKSLGGGLPLSAICGPATLMDRFKPVGDVQHSGTFNAPLPNILAGKAFCAEVTRPEFYPQLLSTMDYFYEKTDAMLAKLDIPVQIPRHGARFGIVIGLDAPPVDYRDALRHRVDLMLEFVRQAHSRGVYFHDYGGGPCHHGFSTAHTRKDIDQILQVMEESFAALSF